MPRIRCHYEDCAFLKEGYCGAAAIELDPDSGCLTYTISEDSVVNDLDDFDELDELLEEEDEDDSSYEDEEELLDNWDEEDDY